MLPSSLKYRTIQVSRSKKRRSTGSLSTPIQQPQSGDFSHMRKDLAHRAPPTRIGDSELKITSTEIAAPTTELASRYGSTRTGNRRQPLSNVGTWISLKRKHGRAFWVGCFGCQQVQERLSTAEIWIACKNQDRRAVVTYLHCSNSNFSIIMAQKHL